MEDLKPTIREDVSTGINRPMEQYLDWALQNLKRRYPVTNKYYANL